jgi:hypothetical protein
MSAIWSLPGKKRTPDRQGQSVENDTHSTSARSTPSCLRGGAPADKRTRGYRQSGLSDTVDALKGNCSDRRRYRIRTVWIGSALCLPEFVNRFVPRPRQAVIRRRSCGQTAASPSRLALARSSLADSCRFSSGEYVKSSSIICQYWSGLINQTEPAPRSGRSYQSNCFRN